MPGVGAWDVLIVHLAERKMEKEVSRQIETSSNPWPRDAAIFVCEREEWGIIPHAIKIGGVLVACGGGGGVDVTWVQWVWRNRYVAVRHRMLSRIPVRAREAWQKVNLSGTDYPSMVAIGPRIGYPPRSMPRKSAGWSRKVPSLHQALIQ
jgi:hypothetical protein